MHLQHRYLAQGADFEFVYACSCNAKVSRRIDSAPTRTRTWNLLIRSQILYPIELWVPAASDFLGEGWGIVKIFCRLRGGNERLGVAWRAEMGNFGLSLRTLL